MTTATGLTVAIPLLIFLHVFDRKREKTAVELEKFGSLFVHLRDDMLASGKGPELTRRAG